MFILPPLLRFTAELLLAEIPIFVKFTLLSKFCFAKLFFPACQQAGEGKITQ
jgi:hypothetical protein